MAERDNIKDLLTGTIALSWPGKQCSLEYHDEKWHLLPFGKFEKKKCLLYDSSLGSGQDTLGYAIKADIISALKALHAYVPSQIQLIYFDAPRLNLFQNMTESGYTVSTWLSLIQQSAVRAVSCLKRTGFFALHTDEQMSHYARVVLDEVFGQSNYVGTFAWQKQYAPQNDHSVPTDVLDYITVYCKSSIENIEKIGLLVTPKDLKDDGDFRGCYIDGHKGARSGSEATKFKVNTSPYHWEIVEANLPDGRYHFDQILGSLWFESVNSVGDYDVTVKASDKRGNTTIKKIKFSVREPKDIHDEYSIPDRIWWLMKNDNDIVKGGELSIKDFPDSQSVGIKGQEFSLVFQAEGGEPFTMKSDSPGSGRYWEFGKQTLIKGIARAMASFGNTGGALPSIKKYFNRDNAKKRQAVMNFLPWYDFGDTQDATQHCKALKTAGITRGDVNMMAKPQKLLGHLVSLLAPHNNDIVMSLGETNGVFSSVALKLNRRFLHVVGADSDEVATWDETASARLLATMLGSDNETIEGNDALPNSQPKEGNVVVLKLSKSCLIKNLKNGDVEPDFHDDECIEDFYAGLSGAYKTTQEDAIYHGINGNSTIVIPFENPLDSMTLESECRKFPQGKLTVIYESAEGDIAAPKNVILKRAPFELI